MERRPRWGWPICCNGRLRPRRPAALTSSAVGRRKCIYRRVKSSGRPPTELIVATARACAGGLGKADRRTASRLCSPGGSADEFLGNVLVRRRPRREDLQSSPTTMGNGLSLQLEDAHSPASNRRSQGALDFQHGGFYPVAAVHRRPKPPDTGPPFPLHLGWSSLGTKPPPKEILEHPLVAADSWKLDGRRTIEEIAFASRGSLPGQEISV